MARQAQRSSAQGLLLIEAVLAAVVVAVGLAYITRGLGTQLRELRSIVEYDRLASLAQGKLLELEARPLSGGLLSAADQEGAFDEPYAAYQWGILLGDEFNDDDEPMAREITIEVKRAEGSSTTVTLHALWPIDWIP